MYECLNSFYLEPGEYDVILEFTDTTPKNSRKRHQRSGCAPCVLHRRLLAPQEMASEAHGQEQAHTTPNPHGTSNLTALTSHQHSASSSPAMLVW